MRAIKGLIGQIHKKVKKSGSKGFSLAEMLFAVLILLLASQLIAESMRLASAHYKSYTNIAHAQMIMSTLTDFVRSEITTASEIDDTNGITFLDGSGLIGGRCKIVDGDTLYLQSIKEPDRKYYPIVGMEGSGPHDYAEELKLDITFQKEGTGPTDTDPYWRFNLSIKIADKKGKELAKGNYDIEVPGEVKDN
ncbi:hypothetical protein [Butyrivibrio sp. INlla16]|uniref:hypothetical protein n=1 Tax=Butyrivibrio sp. INlla16 TaxID=1520807 RepID=UPI00088B045A|nr:hypothetical protein [Butyrivibrio sp. INlla16]SDB14985.1 hypothetical protein SAMN02910263_00719 [Butyrivibrio sp. INlla16]